jgi:hypothetical protein
MARHGGTKGGGALGTKRYRNEPFASRDSGAVDEDWEPRGARGEFSRLARVFRCDDSIRQ